ncbi:MAG: hypothetical protein PUI94_02330 [Eubacteriales bacterium]|nr:hypothetical protein [Eubacteriales bacterium]
MANKKIYRWIALGAAVLALLALIMAFVPTVSLNIGTETKKFSAFSVAFGGIIATESGATLKFTFNFVGFIAIILFVPGFILAIVAAAKSEGKKAISIVSAVFLILSAILMFLLLNLSSLKVSFGGHSETAKLLSDDAKAAYNVKTMAGSVLYGVMALLSGVASIVSAVFNKN